MFYLLRKKLHWQYFCVAALYLIFNLSGLHGFQAEHSDHIPMMEMLLEAGDSGDGLFAVPLYFYSGLSGVGIPPSLFSLVFGLFILYFLFEVKVDVKTYFIRVFFCIAPIVTFLGQPGKELFLLFFFTMSIYFYRKGFEFKSQALLLVYAILFRYYYFVIPLFLWTFKKTKRLFCVLFFIVVMMVFIPFWGDLVLNALLEVQARRDFGFENGFGVVRTVFPNIVDVEGWGSFFVNYINAFYRLNLPVFTWFTLKEIFLQIVVLATYSLVVYSLCKGSRLAVAILIMLLMYPLFEPDLGSYLRHFTSMMPLFYYLIDRYIARLYE